MPAEQKYITVSEINAHIAKIVNTNDTLQNICILGEVSGFKVSGAHAYFTLKDENAQLRCVCFSYIKTYKPRDGETVLLKGSLDYYAKGGQLSFKVLVIEPAGQGVLAFQLQQLKQKLSDQGYFDASHKQPVPPFLKNVLVITSKTGAVIRDIVTTVRKKNDFIDLKVFDVKVQGENSAASIIEAIKTCDPLGFDVIIIARGGGSFEDLMPFNDEKLVYAVYHAKTPIISAVGHETDFTLVDFVADLRAPTPTAAAEYVAFDTQELRTKILDTAYYIADKLNQNLTFKMGDLKRLSAAMRARTELQLSQNGGKLLQAARQVRYAAEAAVNLKATEFEQLMQKIEANNPMRILAQGYYKMMSGGREVLQVTTLKKDDRIEIVGHDGRVTAKVEEVKEQKNEI